MYINIFGRNIYVRSKFPCLRSSRLCARAQLRGNIGYRGYGIKFSSSTLHSSVLFITLWPKISSYLHILQFFHVLFKIYQ